MKLEKKKYSARLFSVFFTLFVFWGGSIGITKAQDNKTGKVKVSPDEAKAVKKIEEAKTLDEKIKATEEFIQKYPKSPVRDQAASYLAGQIMQLKDDSQIVAGGEKYLLIFTEPAEADIILPALIYSYTQQKRFKEAFAAAEKISFAASRRCNRAAAAINRRRKLGSHRHK